MVFLKDETINFNADIADGNNFKYFSNYANLLTSRVADRNSSILKNTTIAVPLQYVSKFWGSLKMQWINRKVELKLRWTKDCLLASDSVENNNADTNNTILIINDTTLYVPAITLSAKNNQNLSKHFSKEF